MQIATKSVVVVAQQAGLPETVIDRHLDELTFFALRLRKAERKICQNKLRGWALSNNPAKGPVTAVLEECD